MRALLKRPRGRVVVVGGGRQGRAAGRLLASLAVPFEVADDGARDVVSKQFADIGLAPARVTSIADARCESADLLVLSAGVPRAHDALGEALRRAVPIVSEIDLAAAQLDDATFVGITGTNGKSTTTTIAGAIATVADREAFVGGNLGTPLSDAVASGARPRLVVLELSSYQLETLSVPRFASAIVTNLSPDHLDRYATLDEYYGAKARLFTLLDDDGGSGINRRDEASVRFLDGRARGRHFDFDVDVAGEGVELVDRVARVRTAAGVSDVSLASPHLVGHHNLQNAAAAIAAMTLAGVSADACRAGIAAYAGIKHRLERVAEANGVVFVNDSKATNVDAAIKAVTSFARGVHLIAGGKGKGSPYAPLVDAARGRVARVYAIGEDASSVAAAFDGVCPVVMSGDLARAFNDATEVATFGDTVLLAPACASFDQWKNYEERGDAFRALAVEHARRATGGPR